MTGKVYAVSGIDTDIGKTVATGLLARNLMDLGFTVMTQKLVQTGCQGISEDILFHRKLMGVPPYEYDEAGESCPYVFPDPCSPHLAARRSGRRIELTVLDAAVGRFVDDYQFVFIEGAGGLMVPLTEKLLFLDYLEKLQVPLLLVSSNRLGSINHTLCSLEVARLRNIEIAGIIYNVHNGGGGAITEDTRRIFQEYLEEHSPTTRIADLYPLQDYLKGGRCNELASQLGLV